MGTPDFAVASLKALLDAGFEVVGVVTAPDKPAGRGQKLVESAVKKAAVAAGIPVLQPEKLRSPEFLDHLQKLNADLHVVVAFRMLPEVVWNMPPKGTVNVHGSLLPAYRGAAPINRAILNGETETGVTTFFLQQEIDTGNILFTERADIAQDTTAGELHDQLMAIGARLIVKTVRAIADNTYTETPQIIDPSIDYPKAPKLHREDCFIRWSRPVDQVYNQIRGLSPYPAAYTTFQDKTLKIYKGRIVNRDPGIGPGAFLSDGKKTLEFACTDGFIAVEELQLEGKKRMGVEEFLRGTRVSY